MVFEKKEEFVENISEWNPAQQKMRRIGQNQDRLQEYRLNPKKFFNEYDSFGYELWMRDLYNSYLEVYARCSDEEQKEINAKKFIIETAMKHFPVLKSIKTSKGLKMIWDDKLWSIFLREIEGYEKLLIIVAEKYGLDSPTKGESSLF